MLGDDHVIVELKSGSDREVVGPEVDAGDVGRREEGGRRGDVAAESGTERLREDVVAVEQLQAVVAARNTVVGVFVFVGFNVETRDTQFNHLTIHSIRENVTCAATQKT